MKRKAGRPRARVRRRPCVAPAARLHCARVFALPSWHGASGRGGGAGRVPLGGQGAGRGGWRREPHALQLAPAPGSPPASARLWARAEAAPSERRRRACCAPHSAVPPAPGPLQGNGGPGRGPWTLALPQTRCTEHERAVSGTARPRVLQPHAPVLWTAKVRLPGVTPRRPPPPARTGPPAVCPRAAHPWGRDTDYLRLGTCRST